ncbi:NAD(P)H-dependent flavin oxidoreductase [Alkalicoccus saliphilus]|uniref:Probable nitronate monooxygenase n=1 Tax=Alkalicoccus saliphilus TaxID=200989 RepID=A0A2T4U2Y6_9BACI|nr:nitronate monooxygenase [Alkalicoccus saliphilus]PTL37761.1 nitronate monooxygenase [Alkalicoccus saliphilus]
MITTKITELFQIKYPIIQGGLQGLGKSPLVSAVSEAGGLGLITAGSYENKKEMMEDIERVKNATTAPFGVNIAIGIRRPMDDFVKGAIEAEVPIVFTSGANPEPYMEQLLNAGIKVVHVSPSLKFAKKAEKLGCEAVVILGYEGGGHPGSGDNTSLSLIPRAVEELQIPVIGAGGFSNGKGLLAALALGAEAVQMGTRFAVTKESPLHEKVKERFVSSNEEDTVLVKTSIKKPMRVLKSENSLKLFELEANNKPTVEELLPYINGESYKKLVEKGEINTGIISAGQGVGLIDNIPSVEALFQEIISDYQERLNQLPHISENE